MCRCSSGSCSSHWPTASRRSCPVGRSWRLWRLSRHPSAPRHGVPHRDRGPRGRRAGRRRLRVQAGWAARAAPGVRRPALRPPARAGPAPSARASLRDVASASAPTVSGASEDGEGGHRDRPAAGPAGATGRQGDRQRERHREQVADPQPQRARPTTACTGPAAGQSTTKPTPATRAPRRAGGPGRGGGPAGCRRCDRRRPRRSNPPSAHRGVGRDPTSSSTNVAPHAVTHHSAAVTDMRTAAATQNARGRRTRSSSGARRSRWEPTVRRPGEGGDEQRGQQREPPAQAQRGGEREGADEDDVRDAGRDVRLGQRDGAELVVVVGERGLDRRQEEPAAQAHDEDRPDGRGHDVTRGQPDRAHREQGRGPPEQVPAPIAAPAGTRPARRPCCRPRTPRCAARRPSSSARARRAGAGRPRRVRPAGRRTTRASGRRPRSAGRAGTRRSVIASSELRRCSDIGP